MTRAYHCRESAKDISNCSKLSAQASTTTQRIKKILATQPTLEIVPEIKRAAVTTAGSGKTESLAYRG
jgi:hypothetical protein